MSEPLYEMQHVARLTGLNPHRIRAWERRYGAVVPKRSETNRRLYEDSDINRLLLLRRAVARGHRIARIANLDDNALSELTGADDSALNGETAVPINLDKTLSDAAFNAACRLDAVALHRILSHSAVSLTHRRFIDGVVQPMLARIGTAWASGELKTGSEHMASAAVRSHLGELLRDALGSVSPSAPVVVVATPAGNRHDLGAMSLALTAADAGWQPVFLGADLPASDIAAVVVQTAAKGAALSISHALEPSMTLRELQRLRRIVPQQTVIFAGGPAATAVQSFSVSNTKGIQWCADLDAFCGGLDTLAVQAESRPV